LQTQAVLEDVGRPVAERRRFVRVAQPASRRITRAAFGIREGNAPEAAAQRDAALRRLLTLADVLAATIALVTAVPLLGQDHLAPASLALLPLVVVASRVMRLHERDELVLAKTTLNEAPALFHLATFYALIMYIGQETFIEGRLGVGQGICLWLAFVLSSLGCRATIRRLGVQHAPAERCLVIGDADTAACVCAKLQDGGNMHAEVAASVCPSKLPSGPDGRATLAGLVHEHEVQRVIVAFSDFQSERLLELVRDCKALGVKVSIKPQVLDVVGSAVVFDDVHGSVFLGVRRFGLTGSEERIKRTIDLVGSLALLVLAAPLLGLIALVIRLDSPGSALFRQVRVGRDGERFSIFKFRTMVADAEDRKADLMALNEAGDGLFKLRNDPRVTRVGRLLRATSLDELPQLLNVLRGEMSLVGPRPLVVDEDQRVEGWHRNRLRLTPGMTGVWQVLGSARIPLREMMALDYMYIVNWSVWNDMQILLRTIPFVLKRRGL
jgi:exopolysaccharide biosynthesis polyprenyl glycosylphosphotransferase